MSWFLARIYDGFMRQSEEACLRAWRAELLARARGAVLEVGAGTGANLPHYGDDVERLVLAEPDPHMRRKLQTRLAPLARPVVELAPHRIDALPFEAATFDTVVCTLVLCSVPDPRRALVELHRVLRPGGALLYLEHVAAEDRPARRVLQHVLEPLWRPFSGNCRLTRRTALTIREAGFEVAEETRESMRKALPWLRPTIRGVARKAR